MTPLLRRLRRCALATALLGATAAQALSLTFDTPTANTAETLAAYGLSQPTYLDQAIVVDGELRLYSQGAAQNSLAFGRFDGDVRIEFDTRMSPAAPKGYVNIGFLAGSPLYIHPGWSDEWHYRPGVNGRLGFVPGIEGFTHFKIDVAAATRTFHVTIGHGGQQASFSFVEPGYVPGSDPLGFTSGMVTGQGFYAAFDNLSVTAVPEPATAALWGLGVLGLVATARRRRTLAACALAAALPATAAVVPLHDEVRDGELSDRGYDLAHNHRAFALGEGVSTVRGRLTARINTSGRFETDVDAFALQLLPGFTVTGVSVSYDLAAPGFGSGVVQHLWRTDITLRGSRAEYMRERGAGEIDLFDIVAPFEPVVGTGQTGVFWVQMAESGDNHAGNLWIYDYVLSFAVARTVPEPAGAALAALGLGLAGWVGGRRRPFNAP